MRDVVIPFSVPEYEKKEVTVGARIPERILVELDGIAHDNDRTRGYVIRQLLSRGLAAYRADGQLTPEKRLDHSGPLPAGRIRVSRGEDEGADHHITNPKTGTQKD